MIGLKVEQCLGVMSEICLRDKRGVMRAKSIRRSIGPFMIPLSALGFPFLALLLVRNSDF